MQWYCPCLESVALLTRQLNKAVSQARTVEDWDLPLVLLPEAREEQQFWVNNLPRMADVAKPMWQLTSQQMLEHFQQGQAGADACLSTDASLHGWGAVLDTTIEGKRCQLTASGGWVPSDGVQREEDNMHRHLLKRPDGAGTERTVLSLHGPNIRVIMWGANPGSSAPTTPTQAQNNGPTAARLG